MTQIPEALLRISHLLQVSSPQKIIEFGTGYGGLSVLFSLYAKIKNIDFNPFIKFIFRVFPKNESFYKYYKYVKGNWYASSMRSIRRKNLFRR